MNIKLAITKNGKPCFDKNGNIDYISLKEDDSNSFMTRLYNGTQTKINKKHERPNGKTRS